MKHICPVCKGHGTIPVFINTDPVNVVKTEQVCHKCGGTGTRVMTRADWIRSMSDEELAAFLEGDYGNMMPGKALAWLQQPTEGV